MWDFFLIKKRNCFKNFYVFFNKKWFFDRIYNQIISQKLLNIGYFFSYRIVDRGVIELIGPYGLTNFIIVSTSVINFIDRDSVKKDLHLLFFSILICLLFIFIKVSFVIIITIFLLFEFFFFNDLLV
jgi:NADH-ubiquinone oxidoreductase chain 5